MGLVVVLHVALVLAGLLLGSRLGTLLLELCGGGLHFLLGLLGPALGHGLGRLLASLHHALLKLELRLHSSLVVVDWSRGRLVWLHHRLRGRDRFWLEHWWEGRSRSLHRRRRHRGAPRASLAHLGTVVEVVALVVGALDTLALLRVANVLLWGSHRSRSRGRLWQALWHLWVVDAVRCRGWDRRRDDWRGRRDIHNLLVSLGHGDGLGGRLLGIPLGLEKLLLLLGGLPGGLLGNDLSLLVLLAALHLGLLQSLLKLLGGLLGRDTLGGGLLGLLLGGFLLLLSDLLGSRLGGTEVAVAVLVLDHRSLPGRDLELGRAGEAALDDEVAASLGSLDDCLDLDLLLHRDGPDDFLVVNLLHWDGHVFVDRLLNNLLLRDLLGLVVVADDGGGSEAGSRGIRFRKDSIDRLLSGHGESESKHGDNHGGTHHSSVRGADPVGPM